MAWEVEFTNEFGGWWNGLTEDEQARVEASVRLLQGQGPRLGYPHSSKIHGSRHGRMRELRVQSGGSPIRVLYALDPRRAAILLIGGDKTGDDRFYDRMVPVADQLYDEHVQEIESESG